MIRDNYGKITRPAKCLRINHLHKKEDLSSKKSLVASSSGTDSKPSPHNVRKLSSRLSDKPENINNLPKIIRHESLPKIKKHDKETVTDIIGLHEEPNNPYEDLQLTRSELLSKYVFKRLSFKTSWSIPVFSSKFSLSKNNENFEIINDSTNDIQNSHSEIKEDKLFDKAFILFGHLMGMLCAFLSIASIVFIMKFYESKPNKTNQDNDISFIIKFLGNF